MATSIFDMQTHIYRKSEVSAGVNVCEVSISILSSMHSLKSILLCMPRPKRLYGDECEMEMNQLEVRVDASSCPKNVN
jgi:hypothetical protein